ncbi:MAG: adenosylcobinamide-GDP ribazoletransferase [bacterium]
MSGLAIALGFLTRVPTPGRALLGPGALARAAVWFPVVGALVGLVVGGTRLLAELVVPAEAATVLALAAGVLVTGGLHEDGLADTADGAAAHASRERRLEIMRDPRLGSFGTLALVLVVLLSWTLLAGLDGEDCLRAAVAGHVLARWAMLVHAATSPPARPGGAGTLLRVGRPALAAATVLAGGLTVLAAGPAAGAAAAGAAIGLVAALGAMTRRALGGATGDTYGAVGKLAEVGGYVAVVALWRV